MLPCPDQGDWSSLDAPCLSTVNPLLAGHQLFVGDADNHRHKEDRQAQLSLFHGIVAFLKGPR